MKEIYNNNKYMISTIKKSVYGFRRQNFDMGLRQLSNIIQVFTETIAQVISCKAYFNENIFTVDEKDIMNVLCNLTNAQDNREFILIPDLLELQLMPLIISWQEVIQSKEDVIFYEDRFEENIDFLKEYNSELASLIQDNPQPQDGYEAEPTTSGAITIKVIHNDQEFYLVSNHDPQNAAEIFADTYYTPQISHYVLYGMELLYNSNALLDYKDAEYVDVYESDLNIIKLACRYGNLNHLSTRRLNIFYDPEYTQFAEASQEDMDNKMVIMHHASIRNIRCSKIRGRFEQLFMVDSSIRNQGELMLSNFKSNVKYCKRYIDELEPLFEGKDIYIIAAGPSLDKNIELLKKKPANSIILAVGTVYKKLENMGIKTDFIIVSDANRRVIGQISNVKNNQVPMLILSTAYREFALRNEGEHYLICQQDFKEAQEYAMKNHWNLYKTGGSVTTTALDISIQLKASRVIFLGADLAYTDNLAHAAGTSRREHKGTEGLIPVKAIDGGQVYASKLFVMYREWIEKRIENVSQVEIIDATEGGAWMKGTRVCKLDEIISEVSIKNKD
ncbi:motility associated factor glycosyltransferase family protein [Lachnotalea glycerini]|uniref:DUF115 domain-containing protein n=1 Tax=Lachnotalea glycerini TaxID=1763509 RepID=A0A371JES4_9FIRM|nr:6-hydroxymethylpterin diphosphokinase MptE-like protein [Lachnotalea glycerini]RDY31259.1 DUF115 domain-containing protein [Lachnotalea glycerini]